MRFTDGAVLDRPLHNIGPLGGSNSHTSGRLGIGVGGNHLKRTTSETERTQDHGIETCNPSSTISSGVSTTNKMGAGAGLGIQDHVVDDAQYSGVRKNHWQAVQRGQPTVGHGS